MSTTSVNAAAKQELLEHLALYRLAVTQSIKALPACAALPPSELKFTIRRLVSKQAIGKAILYANRPYFYLARKNGKALRPLSELAKVRAYAMLAFTHFTEPSRRKLSPSELAAYSPFFDRGGLPGDYYEVTGGACIGRALIDAAGRGRWDRILARLRDDVRAHSGCDAIREMAHAGRFEWTVITATTYKAERLQESMLHARELRGVTVRVCVIPELIQLIAPPAL